MLDAIAVICVCVAALYVGKKYFSAAKKGSCGCSSDECGSCKGKDNS